MSGGDGIFYIHDPLGILYKPGTWYYYPNTNKWEEVLEPNRPEEVEEVYEDEP